MMSMTRILDRLNAFRRFNNVSVSGEFNGDVIIKTTWRNGEMEKKRVVNVGSVQHKTKIVKTYVDQKHQCWEIH